MQIIDIQILLKFHHIFMHIPSQFILIILYKINIQIIKIILGKLFNGAGNDLLK